jgi:hypothetical protein
MKTLYLVLLSTFVWALFGCSDDLLNEETISDIHVTAELAQTRTAYSEEGGVTHITWNTNDAIGLFTNKQNNLKYVTPTKGTSIELTSVNEKLKAQEGDTVFAYYPFNKEASSSTIPVTTKKLQSTISLSDYDYMYAKGVVKDGKVFLRFQHLFAFLRITLTPSDLAPLGTLGIISSSKQLSVGSLSVENNQLMTGDYSSSIFFQFGSKDIENKNTEVSFYIPILPQKENVKLRFCRYKKDGTLDDCLFVKQTPGGGLQAGNVYKVSANNEIEIYSSAKEKQRDALVDLYQAMDGEHWTNNTNWCSEKSLDEWDCISWYGYLYQINLSHNNLKGTIPETFSALMDADKVYLYGNQLTGDIPQSVTSHKNWNIHWNGILCGNSFNTEHVPAPTFSVRDITGKAVTSDIYAKNKLTILLRWSAKDTLFYQSILPKMVNLYTHYHDMGLEIIGFDVTEGSGFTYFDTRKEIEDFIKDNDIKWPNVVDGGDGNTIYFSSYSYHQAYVVDTNGKFVCTSSYSDVPSFVTNYLSGSYMSSDYSRDGEVFTLQKATVGKGINLVFMGDGFVDRDMEGGGRYEQRMIWAVEDFFSVEPYKSFRNRFNIYGVKVVSNNELWTEEARKSHRINENDSVAFEYAAKAVGESDKYVTVVYSSPWRFMRSYTQPYIDGSFVAYVMETRKFLVVHEACGHGFGQLRDEYIEEGFEEISPTEKEMENFDSGWEKYGRNANVDWRSDLTSIRWAHMINDNRYAGENLGAYEGAAKYGKGMYRPTENSVMHSTSNGVFNAPCREQIYKNIMKRSEGSEWTYDYEAFVEYDAINRSSNTCALTSNPTKEEMKEFRMHHKAPVFIQGTWRDALKTNKRSYTVPLR